MSWGSNLSPQAWQQVPLAAEPSPSLSVFSFLKINHSSLGCEVTALLYMHAVLLCKSSGIPSSFFVPDVDLGYWCSSEQFPHSPGKHVCCFLRCQTWSLPRGLCTLSTRKFPHIIKIVNSLLFSMLFLTIALTGAFSLSSWNSAILCPNTLGFGLLDACQTKW